MERLLQFCCSGLDGLFYRHANPDQRAWKWPMAYPVRPRLNGARFDDALVRVAPMSLSNRVDALGGGRN